MQKGFLVEARLTYISDKGHMVTGYYAVGDDSEAQAEERLVVFLSKLDGKKDSGITAHALRELTAEEVAQIDLRPTQIRQRA